MKRALLTILLFTSIALHSCSSKVYNNKSFLKQVTLEGKKLAILPAEVELTGRLPTNFTASKKSQTEESESKLVQNHIYNQYLFKSKSGKKKAHVELMNVDQVNTKLRQAGIDVRESWSIDADSLGRLLGVDLVLRTSVKKNRIMSETASFGIGVATTVLGNILNNGTNNSVGVNGMAKTYTMYLQATLSDVNTHTVVTRFTHDGEASWSRSPDEIIESSGRKVVRKGVVYARK